MSLRITNISLSSLLKRTANARLTQARAWAINKHDTVNLRLSQGITDMLLDWDDFPSFPQMTQTVVAAASRTVDYPSNLRGTMGLVYACCTDPGPAAPTTERERITSTHALTAVYSTDNTKVVTSQNILVGFKQLVAIPKRTTNTQLVVGNLAVPKKNVTSDHMLVAVWQGSLRVSQARVAVARRRFKVLNSGVTNVAFMLTLERTDGVIKRFTSLDRDLLWQGDNYSSCNSFQPTAVDSSTDMSVDNLDMTGVLDTDDIDEDDLLVGKYNDAKVTLFIVDWLTLGPERYILRTGTFGKLTQMKQQFQAEVRGLLQQAQEAYGEVYQATCRVKKFGDFFCKLDLTPFTFTGVAVSVVTNNRLFTATALTQDTGYFAYGLLKFETGPNANIEKEIKGFTSGGALEIWEEFPYDVSPGDTFTIVAGCDRKFLTCKNRFGNGVNFRGEKDVPGQDAISQYPDPKQ